MAKIEALVHTGLHLVDILTALTAAAAVAEWQFEQRIPVNRMRQLQDICFLDK
ncbi:MAG: hypothetical protein JXK94_10860 [Deltaproteobacteria bacterium]|nr:hypothetical protein [Deltaproteobacteria bacterium]